MDEVLSKTIDRLVLAQLRGQERDLWQVAATHGRSVIVNTDQRVDDGWLDGRTLVRSPHVRLGTAYEYDPAVLDFRAGLGAQ